MRIAWFTPFDQRSAIGKVGLQTCEKLSEMNQQVDIWAYETENTLKTTLRVIHYDPAKLDISSLKKYDHVIYNMGNFAGYHWAIYDAMTQFPGIVILHDRTMHNFYRQYCDVKYGAGSEQAQRAFNGMIREEYGALGEAAMEAYPSADVIVMNEYITRFSFLRRMCANAKGIFSHSKRFSDIIRDYSFSPTSYAYLPCKARMDGKVSLPGFFVKDPRKCLIVSTGIVHPVKHIQEMVDVMLKNQQIRDSVQYVVIGDYGGPYGDALRHLADKELKGSLYMLGYQPDDVMEAFLNAADICLNLRYPNAEACSLSLLEQMAYGKPVVVFDSGIYGEMPDDAVCKIEMDRVETELKEALEKLIGNKAFRDRIGKQARELVKSQCTLEGYCKRLTSFLETIDHQKHGEFYSQVLGDLRNEMACLGFNTQDIPEAMEDIVTQTAATMNVRPQGLGRRDTIAIWAAMPYMVPGFHREGVMKLNSRLVEALMEVTELRCEIWTYEANHDEIVISFQKSLERWPDRVKVITEQNWQQQLPVPNLDRNLPWHISVEADNLGMVAGKYSEACVFAPVILYLDNVLQTGRPVYVPAMDMSVKYYYEEFTYRDSSRKFLARDIEGKVDRMFRAGMGGYCMSQPIKETQILPLLRNARDEDIGVVWTPDMTSVRDSDVKYSKETIKRLGIRPPYLFYPTQFRPNKNIATLMRAFEMVVKDNQDLKLVFTGRLEDMPDLQKEWKKGRSYSSLIFVHDLSEEELFNVYHFAACVPVTTIMEGGFPAQAIEGLKMNVPVVLADIPVVRERLEGCNLTKDNCGLALFEPFDAKTLAARIEEALAKPDVFRANQKQFWDIFSRYSWKEAAEGHYRLMMKAAGRDI